MSKKWIQRIAAGILVIMIACAAALAMVISSLGTTITSQEFPLSEKWSARLQGNIHQITPVDHSIVIVRTMTEIYALDMQSGKVLWQQRITWHFSNQPPFVKNGKIFISDGNGVLALNPSDGEILWQQPLRHPSGAEVVDVTQDLVAVNDPPYLIVFQAADGVFRWEKEVCREDAQAYFFDNHIVVPCYGLDVMDALTGNRVWGTQLEDGTDRIWESASADGVIYFSQDLEYVTAFDVKKRKLLWKTPLAEEYDSFQAYQVIGDYLAVNIDDQLCIRHRDDGRTAWCTGDLIRLSNPTSLEGVLYLFNGFQKGITAYDLHDGSQIGTLDFPAFIFITVENKKQLMVSSEGLLIFANGKEIYAYGK